MSKAVKLCPEHVTLRNREFVLDVQEIDEFIKQHGVMKA